MAMMDPRVAAIMAKLETDDQKPEEVKQPEKVKPPTTLEEFMKAEGLDEWPQRLTSEGAMDIQSEALLLGSHEDIANLLRESAPLGLYMLEDLETRLDKLEDKLRFYASQIITEEKPEEREEVIPFGVNKAFITQLMESDLGKSQSTGRGRKMLDFVETLKETRKKTLEYCQFPGFRPGELIELPAQLESLPILHRVTKAQNFNPGFRKFWKKLFLSEASVAVMQDTFWWFFLSSFDKSKVDEMNELYDRIADSFTALFTSTHKDVKDKFLSVYPDCLAQAIYMAYWEAFPESRGKMDETFKQNLINCVSEWVTGLKPVPGTWKSWNVQKMEAKALKGLEREGSQAANKLMQAAVLNKDMNLSLDMDSFNKMMASLGEVSGPLSTGGIPTPQDMTREISKLTNLTTITNGLSVNSHNLNLPLKDTPSRTSASRLATCATSVRKPPQESHQVGPGPEYERVLFNTSGRSPLISHYLHMRRLRDFKQPGKKRQLKHFLFRICEQTQKDIMEIERKRIETNREINNITKELMMTRNPLDLKILSERIIAIRASSVKASQSVFITSNNLSIETNMNTEPKDIRFILVQEPLYGNLELIGAKVTEFSLQIIMDGVLSYRHRGQGGNEDVFRFAVFAGQARAQSSFVIHIFQTTQNVPPRIVHNSILEVPELGFSTLTTNNLQVTHPNSPPSSIIYTVTAPPSHGRLRVQGRYHRQGDHAHQTFTQENIDQGHISYHHSDFNPSADSFVFDVTNGMQTLKGLQFAIEIIPTRLELEIQNFTVQEGMRKALTKNNIRLKSRYYDSKTITFTVVKQPGHGWLEEAGRRGQRLTTFTFAQLSQGRVYYLHDNSESLSDSFTVRGRVEEEGKDSREGVVYVSIQTINDQSPTVVINRQLKMWRSSLALITKEHLRADDSDSSPTEITYQVLSTTNGRVAFVNNAFRSIQSFNQEQVNRNQVVFVHDGDDEGGFMFYVTDGTNTDHKRENFNVLAEPLTLTLVKNSPLKVYPGRGHTITPQNLLTKTNDLNQTKPIIYHVLQKPKKGRIVTMYKDRALEVMSFKQEDINDGKIIYQHDAYLTKWTDHDNFTFEVRTLYAADIQNMMFKIQISYGNFQNQNQNDDIHVEGFVVQEGGSHVLSKQNIDATNYTRQQENNGKRARIWFSLLSKPMNGELYKGGRIISRGDRFLQSEINDGQISYQHDNSDTSNDSFVFNVHVEIQQAGKKEVEVQEMKGTFYISVLPLNDQPFRILSVNPVIQVVEGMSTVVSSDILKTVDLDTPPGGITYNVKTLPSNGILGYSGNSMQQIRQFTQKDIDDGKVTFTQHGSKQRGSFEVEVSDGKFPANSTSVSVSVVPITLHVTSNRTIYILQADTSVYITKDNLDISTNGNRQKIHYEIKIPPKYGQIFQLVYPVTFFKQVDIDKRNILYIQRNLSSHMDYFFCDIYYEGSSAVLRNKRVIVMVKPLVKQQPITSTIGGRTPVTTKNLDASQLANITGYTPRYTIIERPKFGHIVKIVRSRRDTNGRSQYKEVDQFTHEDVLYVRIYYVPQNFQFVREVEDSFSYLLSSRGVQPALGKMTLRVAPYPGYTTPRGGGRSHFDKPNADKNSTLFSEEPDRGEIVSPNVSPDFIIILAILIPLFVLVIFIIVIDGTTAPDDSHSLLYEHHNYLNVPIKSDGKHYANAEIGQGHSDADDLDSDSDNESNVISPLVDPDMTEISATVPECKVTPLLGAKRRPKEKDSGCDMDLFDWSMIEDPEFLQHCRTTTPVLKDNQYWV
ncbi:hypothetical protein FSP39_009958 [Pinctada imbricata]|uniref:Uncharacterized protein n=1 Tax=Pinctada imbricata TaxID=66713 RepID=A0AA88YDV0_PINIB|nr:hypothetical protein FSP39_009958 [Pinctada imbricata]